MTKTSGKKTSGIKGGNSGIANLRPWPKGVSGNPSGRPKDPVGAQEIRALARSHASEAVGTLVHIMRDEMISPSARVTAASTLLDRGFGRAEGQSTVTLLDGGLKKPSGLSLEELTNRSVV